jgi:hypothetical protein
MRYHINPKTGEPGKCSAKNGGCPFGGENEHYTSPEAAREAFEADNSASTFTMSVKDMNALAKTTDDHSVIAGLIAKGTDRTLSNLAKNPNLTDQEVRAALAKTKNVSVRANLLLVNHGPAELMAPEDLEEILSKLPPSQKRESFPFYRGTGSKLSTLVNNVSLSDAHYDQVMLSPNISSLIKDRFVITLGEDNKISGRKTLDFIEAHGWRNHPVRADKALANGKLTEDDLMNVPEGYLDNFTSLSPNLSSANVSTLGRVAGARGHDRLQEAVAKDSRTSGDVLDFMARHSMHPKEVYLNPNTPAEGKARLEEKYRDQPYVRMERLRKNIGAKDFESIMKPAGGSQLGRSYSESALAFDMEKVRQYGLTMDDIRYLGKAEQFNAGSSFNPETGVLTGRIDSSD